MQDSPFTYFIRGNHEDFNYLASFSKPSAVDPWHKIFFIPDGHTVNIIDNYSLNLQPLVIGGFGGIPPSQEQRMRGKIARKKYRKSQQNTCCDLRFFNESFIKSAFDGLEKVDILLTHAGPKFPNLPEGSALISELAERVKPRVHLFGHHHKVVGPCKGPGDSLLVGLEHLNFTNSGELTQGSWGILSINEKYTEFIFPSSENFECLRTLRHGSYRSLLTPGIAIPTLPHII
ncbi:MAG: metallophosphoesterase [Aphanothece sp. CMT-3BRIN-NPC111]|jgi:predicted phosphohydrolase|nr:metallophosphoesterase [Aphanothece sp. CMT-3BRIN-NPC111]